jgi:hypothetical protein
VLRPRRPMLPLCLIVISILPGTAQSYMYLGVDHACQATHTWRRALEYVFSWVEDARMRSLHPVLDASITGTCS